MEKKKKDDFEKHKLSYRHRTRSAARAAHCARAGVLSGWYSRPIVCSAKKTKIMGL